MLRRHLRAAARRADKALLLRPNAAVLNRFCAENSPPKEAGLSQTSGQRHISGGRSAYFPSIGRFSARFVTKTAGFGGVWGDLGCFRLKRAGEIGSASGSAELPQPEPEPEQALVAR